MVGMQGDPNAANMKRTDSIDEEVIDAAKDSGILSIRADLAQRVTFASHQNDVAVVLGLVVANETADDVDDLTLEISAAPPVIAARAWRIDRIPAGGETLIRDRKVPLAGGMLQELTEAMRAEVRLTLHQGDAVLAEERFPIRALARNEWGGARHMPELLAAFVTPNDPAVSRILKDASGILKSAGRTSSIDGYTAKARTRVWELASAIWAAVTARNISYALPPASFEREGQKVRLPSDIENEGLATCLDTTLLFAAALEQAGLNAVVAFTEGHALAGVWLQPQHLPSMTVEDAMELRKAIALDELILFETTLATQDAPLPFARAIKEGATHLAQENEDAFIYAIDIAQARSRGVQPLSMRLQPNEEAGAIGEGSVAAPPTLDQPPALPVFDTDILEAGAEAPSTPAERLERWKRSLLDLSKRNRMLNVKESRTAIPIFCRDPAMLEDLIAEGNRIKLITPPTPKGADAEIDTTLRKLRTGEDLDIRFAEDALHRKEVVANTDKASLEKGAIELYRKAKTDIEEGGANTLFLALGMLRWRPNGEQVRHYRAPLILLPVKLERRSAASQPFITSHDDDPVFNLTLLEMLRQDFDIDLPQLAGDLPTDESGVDVRLIWEIVRARVREVAGFEVVEEVVLSTFSFAKYLMWKDLADRTEVLKQSPFVRHMIDTPREAYEGGAKFMRPEEIDRRVDPKDLLAPLNADSSQIVAIHASAEGGDFVLEGPPGTGKSETIGNIIAHNLGLGRKILFVSEKMAALEVVYRRLQDKGLGDFCLELHSAKANKKAIIQQLGAAWDERSRKSKTEWSQTATELASTRRSLNGLVEALHAPGPAGISPRAAIGRALNFGDVHRLVLDWPADLTLGQAPTPEAFQALKTTARKLALEFQRLEPEDFDAFEGVAHGDWSNAWQTEAAASAKALTDAIGVLGEMREAFVQMLGLSALGSTVRELDALVKLARLIPDAHTTDLAFALAPDAHETITAIGDASESLAAYKASQAELTAPYADERIDATRIDGFRALQADAARKIWPFSALALGGLRKSIRMHFALEKSQAPVPENDLGHLQTMAKHSDAMNKSVAGISASAPWRGLDSNLQHTATALRAGIDLRAATTQIAGYGHDLPEVRAALRVKLSDGRDLLEQGMPLAVAATALIKAAEDFYTALVRFSATTAYEGNMDDLTALASIALELTVRERRLNAWCGWVEARREASSSGLGTLVTALASGGVRSEQAVEAVETAYCQWVAPLLVDSREALKRFSVARHEDAIETFRRMDKELADLASGQIRASLSGAVPGKEDARGEPGYGVLARELQKKMRHKPVRQLIGEMGPAVGDLTPCMMMSPLSVAQFLPADQAPFDLVVFDEASQITVPDAIGAIARGKNCIIVGDPKQMPPTRFFERAAEEDGSDDQRDLESILDEALAARTPLHRLTGHYRSRHESLICFSNHAYYGGELVTYPAADTRDSAVSFRRVDGVYAKGKSRTNEVEAKAVAAEVTARLSDPARNGASIGVVALNSEQQRLIEDLLDQARRQNPDLEPFFGPDAEEPVFVKNLETVQGDQRDVILISIGYGPTEPGGKTMSMNFGPLNRDGGERRLNVAITRATTEVVVFASFDPGMIDLSRTSASAVRDLKHYLDFADRGPVALGEAIRAIGGDHDYDSDFEAAVAEGLRGYGWIIRTQIGVSKFRIDLGVVHPDAPGRFLAGVECDGATYHSSPSARDRDRVRHIILEQLGWRLLRIWSTDFFNDPRGGLQRLHANLSALLEEDRSEQPERPIETEEAANEEADADTTPPALSFDTQAEAETAPEDDPILARAAKAQSSGFITADPVFQVLAESPDLSPEVEPNRFYESSYLPSIRTMAVNVIDRQGPIIFKDIARSIARIHGFQRTGREINSIVWQACNGVRVHTRVADGHNVFWPSSLEPSDMIPFRGAELNGERRSWSDLPYPEKLGLIDTILDRSPPDVARAAANAIGQSRTTKSFREDVEQLVHTATEARS